MQCDGCAVEGWRRSFGGRGRGCCAGSGAVPGRVHASLVGAVWSAFYLYDGMRAQPCDAGLLLPARAHARGPRSRHHHGGPGVYPPGRTHPIPLEE